MAKVKIEVWQDKPYAVRYFQSHPDEGNDDCITGDEYATLAEAEAVFASPPRWADGKPIPCEWVVLEGTGGDRRLRRNPDWTRTPDDDDEGLREHAMQAGMGLGVAAYNDAMGYDLEPAFDEDERGRS